MLQNAHKRAGEEPAFGGKKLGLSSGDPRWTWGRSLGFGLRWTIQRARRGEEGGFETRPYMAAGG